VGLEVMVLIIRSAVLPTTEDNLLLCVENDVRAVEAVEENEVKA